MKEDTKLSLKEGIKNLLKEAGVEVQEDFFHSNVDHPSWCDKHTQAFISTIESQSISFQEIDRYGGEEQGSEFWTIYEFSNQHEKVFVKFNGFYASYSGSEYEEFFLVEPVQVQKFEYNKVL